jgi:hypothetical protein
MTAQVEADMEKVPKLDTQIWQDQRDDELKRRLNSIRFNEIIGYIEVHIVGSQLRADYWFTDKSRIVLGSRSKGRLTWRGKLLEKHFPPHRELSSSTIFEDFRKSLHRAVGESDRLRKRYVDFTAFDRCGPFIDWSSLIKANLTSEDSECS